MKLGKNPGGGCAARTTNDEGKVNFGVWLKGQYDVTLAFPQRPALPTERTTRPLPLPVPVTHAHVVIEGAVGGRIEREVSAETPTQRQLPVVFELDGRTELTVTVLSD